MVKPYDRNFRYEDVSNVKGGDVIVYPCEAGYNNYLIVRKVDGGKISGEIASGFSGVNSVSAKDIVSACKL